MLVLVFLSQAHPQPAQPKRHVFQNLCTYLCTCVCYSLHVKRKKLIESVFTFYTGKLNLFLAIWNMGMVTIYRITFLFMFTSEK